jgi:hypothetical protein
VTRALVGEPQLDLLDPTCYASAMPAQLASEMRLQNFTPISDRRYFELAIPDCGASEAQP